MNPDLMEFILEVIYLKKIKDGAYVINCDEYSDIGTHWIAMYSLNNNVTYFDSFGVENIPKEIRKFIANNSVMCAYFCSGFIDFIDKYFIIDKNLTDFTYLFSPNDFQKKKEDIILNYFENG